MSGYSTHSGRPASSRRAVTGRPRKVAVAAVAAGLAAVMLSGCNPRDLVNAGHSQPAPTTSRTAPPAPTTTAAPVPTTTAAATTTASTTTTTAPTTITTAPTSTVTSSPTTTTTAPTTSATVAPVPVGQACTAPKWTSSTPDDMWGDGGYIVHNNMWNADGYTVKQSTSACSYHSWNVTATADNNNGDGAVKTYPNSHKDYHNWSSGAEPKLSSFTTLKSTFAAAGPGVGIYNVAYDIWLNGVPGKNEVMIWTENHGQTPSGSIVQKGVVLSGITWDVWATGDNGYIAFVPRQVVPSGTLDLKAMLNQLVTLGRVAPTSTLGQICFGVEIVSTGGAAATFRFTDFSVTDS